MSEEAANAAKAVPLGILSSIGMCCTLTIPSPFLFRLLVSHYLWHGQLC